MNHVHDMHNHKPPTRNRTNHKKFQSFNFNLRYRYQEALRRYLKKIEQFQEICVELRSMEFVSKRRLSDARFALFKTSGILR